MTRFQNSHNFLHLLSNIETCLEGLKFNPFSLLFALKVCSPNLQIFHFKLGDFLLAQFRHNSANFHFVSKDYQVKSFSSEHIKKLLYYGLFHNYNVLNKHIYISLYLKTTNVVYQR